MIPAPQALIAELTHRCPLHCVYCSNPLELRSREQELSRDDWISIFRQAGELGMLQLHLTGGEPLARPDLLELVRAGRAAGLYLNLITSGIGLDAARLDALLAAGLDHIQLSIQDSDEASANQFAGARAHAAKLRLAALIAGRRVAFTLNCVVHRRNLDRLEAIIALAEQCGAQRLEIAHAQYYGWALRNRAFLLPTRAQLDRSVELVAAARERLRGRLRIDFVLPDYYAQYPKPCMQGWGRRQMVVNPAGFALPCHAAEVIPGLQFASIRDHTLRWIWEESPAFNRFRGESWMAEPCRACERRTLDFGGCRCQAYALAGDAAAADPVCRLAPAHGVVEQALVQADCIPDPAPAWIYRPHPGISI